MNFLVSIFVSFCVVQPFYSQAELSIVAHDCEVSHVDPKYFKDIEVYILDNGRDNEFFVNFTSTTVLPKNTVVNFKMLGSSMGEYIVPTGLDHTVPYCESIKEPIIGARIFKSIGINPDDPCPGKTGVYGNSLVRFIETDTLPDTFPANKYRIIVDLLTGDHILARLTTDFEIQ